MKTEDRHYGSLYRRFRPKNFSEIIGQDHIVEALKRQVETDNLAHAYLFSGSRGTGKTSTALVFAKAINCSNSHNGEPCLSCENCRNPNVDIIEMDAASHNSVDDIRELREFVKFAPARGKKKIYIVDEVHMLSNAAFNALLKTLEEPPEHIIFILATTELHMIPGTVRSRCQRYDFKRVSKEGMRRRLLDISESYGVRLEPSAIDLIIRMADGSMRDTLALLEQSFSLNRDVLTEDSVAEFFGTARLSDIADILSFTLLKHPLKLIEILEGLYDSGIDVTELLSAILDILRDIIVFKIANSRSKNVIGDTRVREIVKSVDYAVLNRLFDELTDISKFMRYSKNKESILEITLLKFSVNLSQIETYFPSVLTKESESLKSNLSKEAEKVEEKEEKKEEKDELKVEDLREELKIYKPQSAEVSVSENASKVSELSDSEKEESHTSNELEVQSSEKDEKQISSASQPEQKIRTREELDQIWSEILKLISEEKLTMLKNSQIGIFVGDEIVVNIKGLSKAREMLVEMKLKADVINAARMVTGIDCNVKFVGIEKDKASMEHDAENVQDYFNNKGISVLIK